MTVQLRLPPLLLSDPNGVIWKEHHLKCELDTLVPAINDHAANGPAWWWYCENCQYFVRPLKSPELSIVNRVLDKALKEQHAAGKKGHAKRQRPKKGGKVSAGSPAGSGHPSVPGGGAAEVQGGREPEGGCACGHCEPEV